MLKKILSFLFLSVFILGGHATAEDDGFTVASVLPLDYAQCFTVETLRNGCIRLTIQDGACYLLVPEDIPLPKDIPEELIILRQPLKNIYVAASASMALFNAINALDSIRLCSSKPENWYIENVVQAMNDGQILFGGKYSEPDFELLLSEGCSLAIENTMIYHSPKTKEMLEDLNIPVLVDRSSYEPHPLGRTEWVKLYGILTGKEEEALAFFETQKEPVEALRNLSSTDKTVAFFYISTQDTAVVRSGADSIAKMIAIAGGKYIYDSVENDESSRTNISITMEQFYADAVDADILIYNGIVDDTLMTKEDLLNNSPLLADFKAFREDHVYTCSAYLYQATDSIGTQISDLHKIINDETEGLTFMQKLK